MCNAWSLELSVFQLLQWLWCLQLHWLWLLHWFQCLQLLQLLRLQCLQLIFSSVQTILLVLLWIKIN